MKLVPGENYSPESAIQDFLKSIGEDPSREGLRETPHRFIRAWQHSWASGYSFDSAKIAALFKTFDDGSKGYDEFIVVKDIPLYSHCEHHLAPFFGVAHVGYIPDGPIIGLSKLVRLVEVFARRLQVQERLTRQIGDAIQEHAHPKACGVIIEARHLCMESRGVRTPGTTTLTSAMYGLLRHEPETRAEFMKLIGK